MTTITPKEYLEMQTTICASLISNGHGPNSPTEAKEVVDKILKLNSIIVSDSPKIEAMTRDEFFKFLCNHFIDGYDISKRNHPFPDKSYVTEHGWKILEQRGMVKV